MGWLDCKEETVLPVQVGVQRSGAGERTLSGETVIEEGDFLWCDFGIIAMGLWTDTQHVPSP